MNRQTKRMMKKDEERKRSAPRPVKQPGAPRERTKPLQFFREVIAELQKVAWPSRQEVGAYSLVVLVSAIVIAAIVFGMDYVFTKGILSLYDIQT